MTFIVSPKGVKNTRGTKAKFGGGGSVQVGGDFQNTGQVEVDIRANLNVLGSIINAGNFQIRDYVSEERYKLIENAIGSLDGEAKTLLQNSYAALKVKNLNKSNNLFKRFFSYLQDHPELITDSVQILLQLVQMKS